MQISGPLTQKSPFSLCGTIIEVMEDWWPGELFDRSGYDVKSASLLAARACRAFHEFMPLRYVPSEPGRIYRKIPYGPLLDLFLLDLRSYRGSNQAHPDSRYGPDSYLLGPAQVAWLKRQLKRSTATWKVIASDTPIGTVAAHLPGVPTPVGRGIEIADLLSFMQRAAIRNTVWITADLHYTAAHYLDPDAAVFQDFEPLLGICLRARSMPGPGFPAAWIRHSVPVSCFKVRRAANRATIFRHVAACSSLVT